MATRLLLFVKLAVFLITEIPTLVVYIKAELPSVQFSELDVPGKAVVVCRVCEAFFNWLRKAINHYIIIQDDAVGDANADTLPN